MDFLIGIDRNSHTFTLSPSKGGEGWVRGNGSG